MRPRREVPGAFVQFLPESVLDDGLLDVSTIGAPKGADVDEIAASITTGSFWDTPW